VACPAKRRAYSTTWNVRARRGLSPCAAPPARILHDHASGEESIDDIVRALENGTVRDLHVRELDLSGTQPFPRRAAAPRAQLAPAGAFRFATQHDVLRPNNVATAGCLLGAGRRVKVGTRAWDGLLEALRANLIDALFLTGMLSCAVWLAQPLQDVRHSTRRSQPIQRIMFARKRTKQRERLVVWLVVCSA
jgi:hypothetical protein